MANMAKEKLDQLAVVDTVDEKDLGKEVSIVEQKASAVVINTDEDYANAGELTKQVKRMQKKVKEYWQPIWEPAYAAYKTVNDHKKQMLDPLESAEKILKSKISEYTMRKERERRRKEEAMRKLAQMEMERKLAEAVEAEAKGDKELAEYSIAEAEVMESVSISGSVESTTPKADGVSNKRTWKIVSKDETKIPLMFNGVRLWKEVNETAIKKIIKESNGTVQIPGVVYEEVFDVSIRA